MFVAAGPELELPVALDDPKRLFIPGLDAEPKVFAGCEPKAPNKLELVVAGLGAVALPKVMLLWGPGALDNDDCPPVAPKLNNDLLLVPFKSAALSSAGFAPNVVEPNTFDVLDPLVLKGLGAPNPEVVPPFEASPPKVVDEEKVVGALKPNGDGSGALDVAGSPAVGLIPPLGVKEVKETIGALLTVDSKGLPEAEFEVTVAGVVLFTAELFVDELPNPKLNLGWVDTLLVAGLEVA